MGDSPGLGLSNNLIGGPEQALQRKANLLSNPKTFNHNIKPGNFGFNLNSQQNSQINLQQTGLSKFLNCQTASNILSEQQPPNAQQNGNMEQPLSVQQPPSINLQQPVLNQNMQQSLPLNLQQQILQKHQMALPLNNFQMNGQQVPNHSNNIFPDSLPIVNGQTSGLPSQVSQGVLLSNLGLTSSLPSLLPNSCCCKESVDQEAAIVPQNNFVSLSNVPISAIDRTQAASLHLSSPANNYELMNNPCVLQSSSVPLSFQNTGIQPNQQALYSAQNSYNAMQNQPIQNQAMFNPVQMQPTYVESQQGIRLFENQPSAINPYLLSQLQSSSPPNSVPQYNTVPRANPSIPIVNSVQQSAKSSNIKSLLPLLLNLLKENNGCGCPFCGCMNNNQNNNNCIDNPRVFTGYSNQKTYGQGSKETTINNAKSGEGEPSGSKREPQSSKHKNMIESEEDYEDEDDDTDELNDNND